jgi:3alpha(or 20beta)-hydroxysteroid dehydrogenase
MAGRLDGKVALISGGARGMGANHARRFVEEGARVVIGDVLDDEGAALAAAIGGDARYIHLDVTSADNWAAAVRLAEECYGPVSILVNNAGIFEVGHIDDITEADYRRTIDVNQISVFLGMKAVIASMRAAGGGSIVNISSTAGLHGGRNVTAYCSAKHAVSALTKCGALDLGPDNIRVNSVHPGMIDTPMVAHLPPPVQQPIPRRGTPDEATALVLFLASDEASFCTGGQYLVDGGFTTLVGTAR